MQLLCDIDFSVLPYLTDQALKKIGVLLGRRRKLLRSITNLKGIDSDLEELNKKCQHVSLF